MGLFPGKACSANHDTPSNPADRWQFPETVPPLPHSNDTHDVGQDDSPQPTNKQFFLPLFQVSLIKLGLAELSSSPHPYPHPVRGGKYVA